VSASTLYVPEPSALCPVSHSQVKNSTTRNLHRLTSAIRFIQLLFERLISGSKPAQAGEEAAAGGSSVTLREAAGIAYEEALAPIHTTIVRVSSGGNIFFEELMLVTAMILCLGQLCSSRP
jgi:hypothetical protein